MTGTLRSCSRTTLMPDAPVTSPPFPLDSLPRWQRAMVEAVATATKTDPAVSAMMSLAVLSATVARKCVVETDSEMTPPTLIWVLVIAGTGQGKTPIFGSIVRPLTMVQSALERPATGGAVAVGTRPIHRLSVYDLLREHPLRPRHGAETEDQGPVGVGLEQAVAALQEEQERTHPDVPVEFLTDSLTPTALVELAGSQVTGIAWLAPEGGFDAWIGGGAKGTNNMRRLNQAWDGEDLRERIAGGTRRVAERACLTMGIMMHADAAADVLRNRAMIERGYAYRFLVLVPEQRIGGNVGPFGRIDSNVAERYRRAVWSMMALPSFRGGADPSPNAVQLSQGACEAYWRFYNGLQQRMLPGGDLRDLHGWIEKMCQSVIRLAGILHLAEHAPTENEDAYDLFVAGSTLEKAIAICNYLIPHARLAYGVDRATHTPTPGAGTAPPTSVVGLAEASVMLVDLTPNKRWEGSATDMLAALNAIVPVLQREGTWPDSAPGLGLRLTALEAGLRPLGIAMRRPRSGANGRRIIIWRV